MKKLIFIMLLSSFFACKSSKFEQMIPFKIKKATFQHWIGGQPGIKGINIKFLITDLPKEIELQHVYFNNHKEKLFLKKDEINKIFTANINTSEGSIHVIMHKDPKKESENKLPNDKIPFELKNNECVISYIENHREKFYKLILKKEKNVFYP